VAVKRPTEQNASVDELVEAIAKLTPEERVRLYRSGNFLALGSEFTHGKDLLNEAVKRALIGTSGDRREGERGRPWPKGVHIVAFLTECMRSIANGSQKSFKQAVDRRAEALTTDEGDGNPELSKAQHVQASVEAELVDREDQETKQKATEDDVAAIRKLFAQGDVVHEILDGEAAGMSTEDIREALGITATEYATARKRLRRTVDKHMPGRRLK